MPLIKQAEETVRSFSASGRALFFVFAGICVASSLALLFMLNSALLVAVPAHGGSLSEGIIGAPRFINPVLAISDADRDLSSLVYSGLLKATPDGTYIPDLAQSYTISPDGKTYTFVLKKNATFQDGAPVTADDVVFTIAETQDPAIKSPARANWDGVTVTEVDAETVQFTLKSPYAPFIANLDLGILPKHLWQNVTAEEFPFSELNTSPIGSGPFMIAGTSHTSAGIPSSYTLAPFSKYVLGEPYLDGITFHFYQSEDDLVAGLKDGEIEAASGISPASLSVLQGLTIDRSPLNRVFGVFFNQNQSTVLRDATVRDALNNSIDRSALVAQVLGGYGTPLTGPIPPSIAPGVADQPTASTSQAELIAAARAELLKAGWSPGADGYLQKVSGTGKNKQTTELSFSLATGNVPELRAAAEYLRQTWGQVGVKVNVQIYDQGDLSQNVIRPRSYDALLFGEEVGRELDLFAFWHSSQRNDPGLNIALYANATADSILEQLRATNDPTQRNVLYQEFLTQINKDVPAVFLYSPDFVYIVPKDLQGVDLGFIETPSDRFLSVTGWHRETDYVWPIFVQK
jgi:peptide/nickel transport system substrate-binding protein